MPRMKSSRRSSPHSPQPIKGGDDDDEDEDDKEEELDSEPAPKLDA